MLMVNSPLYENGKTFIIVNCGTFEKESSRFSVVSYMPE